MTPLHDLRHRLELTPQQAARLYGRSAAFFRALCDRGAVPHERTTTPSGRVRLRIDAESLHRYMASRKYGRALTVTDREAQRRGMLAHLAVGATSHS